METPDPFRHHQALRSLVTPPEDSRLRHITREAVLELAREHGLDTGWVLPDSARDICRARALEGRRDRDLWVFAYGSLMWDPGILFTELRRAHARDMQRRFILRDVNGARGTPETPGVMAALDWGEGCNALVYRIDRAHIEDETRRLWNRERIGDGYLPVFVRAQTDQGEVEALAFLANHDAASIAPDLSHEEQVHLCATGRGFLGSSREYLDALASHFEALGIKDAHVTGFLRDVRAYTGTP